jgi:hypothetical protein
METSSSQFIDFLINAPTTGTRAAAGEILRLREGVQNVINALRADREPEFCARRLEILLGLRKKNERHAPSSHRTYDASTPEARCETGGTSSEKVCRMSERQRHGRGSLAPRRIHS